MTTFNTNPNADLNARGRQMQKAWETAEAQVWNLTYCLPSVFSWMAPDPEKEIAKAERRAEARRAVDNLLR